MIRVVRAALAAGLVSGCFGSGPVPSKPDGATVVFAAPSSADPCTGSYIGSVAIGPQAGYAVTLPYSISGCGGGAVPQKSDAPVMQFDKTGAAPGGTMIGTAIAEGNALPRVAATATGAVWAYNDSVGSDITVDPGGLHTSATNPGGFLSPTGIVVDGATTFVAGWQPGNGPPEVGNPVFPCCGTGSPTGGAYSLTKLPGPTQLAVTPPFACETIHDCFTSNASTLFFLAREATNPLVIDVDSFAKSGTSPADGASLDAIDERVVGGTPAGFAASDARVVWTIGPQWITDTGTGPATCQIFVYDLVKQHTDRVFATAAFSCMGAAIDGDAIYVAIVGQEPVADCNGCVAPVHGFGLGRFTIGGGFDSLALGISDQAGGPRGVIIDGADLYALDPLVVAKLAKTALDGKQDFVP